MKTIITIIIGLLLISVASAEVIKIEPKVLESFSIYSGESITRNITIKTDGNYLVYLSWDVEGNSSDMEGFYVDYESPIQVNREREVQVNLSAVYNFYPDSFTIHLFASTEKAEEIIEEPTPSSEGGGCRTTWECTEWGDCINGNQTRDCSKVKSYCYAPKKDKPLEVRECEAQADSEDEEEPIQLEGEEKPKLVWFYILCGVIFLAILFMWYRVIKRERKKKEQENKNGLRNR